MSRHRTLRIFRAFIAMSAFLLSTSLFALTLQAASITEIKGQVKIMDQQGKSRAAVDNAPVMGDEIVDTGKGGSAVLVFDDGSKVELGPSTRVMVNDMMLTGNTNILLYLGRLFAHIMPSQGEDHSYEVQTLSTTAGVRGTEFEVAAGMDGSCLVSVENGQVDLSLEENEVSVSGGEEADISYDGKIVKGRRGKRTDAEWQNWFSTRQQFFIDHSGQVVDHLSRTIDRTRNRISDQDAKMLEMKKRLAKAYDQGNLTYGQARNIARKEIDSYMKSMVLLAQTDNKLMAVDYIISQAQEQIKQNPNAFSPEFKDKIATVQAILNQMNVQQMHKRDQQILFVHMMGIMKTAKKYDLQGEVWRKLPPKTRQQIIKKVEQRKQR